MANRRFHSSENQETVNVTIASGAATSTALLLGGYDVVGMVFPTMTGATITFEGSVDATTYYDMYNASGTQLSVTAQDNAMVCMAAGDLVAAQEIKIVSSTAEAAARTVKMIVRRV